MLSCCFCYVIFSFLGTWILSVRIKVYFGGRYCQLFMFVYKWILLIHLHGIYMVLVSYKIFSTNPLFGIVVLEYVEQGNRECS